MPHTYNRAAFQGGATNPAILLALYCSLIDLELALKDHFVIVAWRNGHHLVDWVSELGEAALSIQLSGVLGALQCTLQDGSVGLVRGNNYPDLRYLRHETDWPGMSTDVQIRQALELVNDVKVALRGRGVNV